MVNKISVNKICMIAELTKQDKFRPEIARYVGVSQSTVYKYQKMLDLV